MSRRTAAPRSPAIRRLDLAFALAALALALAAVARAEPGPADAVKVSVVPADVIRRAVESWAATQVEATNPEVAGGQLRYEVEARWQGDLLLDVPGVVDFRVRSMSSRPFRGPTVVRLDLNVDGEVARTLTVTVDCRLYGDVVVSRHALRPGTELAADALAVEERDVTGLKQGSFASVDELAGMEARRPIGVGEVVSRAHVGPVPVVRRDEEVVLSLETRSMSLLAAGIALQDGGVGQRIRVRNADSKKVLTAEVVDVGTVRVAIDGD